MEYSSCCSQTFFLWNFGPERGKPLQVKREVSLGMIIHTILLLGTIGALYGKFSADFEAYGKTVRETQRQTTRIERYLSSQDREYWNKVAQMEAAQ